MSPQHEPKVLLRLFIQLQHLGVGCPAEEACTFAQVTLGKVFMVPTEAHLVHQLGDPEQCSLAHVGMVHDHFSADRLVLCAGKRVLFHLLQLILQGRFEGRPLPGLRSSGDKAKAGDAACVTVGDPNGN